MFYNVYQRNALNFRSIIIAVEEKHIEKIVNAYLKGEYGVTIKGKSYRIIPDEFAIFRVKEDLGRSSDEIESYIRKYANAYHQGNFYREVFRDTGVDVTEKFLQDREFGSLKKQEQVIIPPVAYDKWNTIHPVIRQTSQGRYESGHISDAILGAYKEINVLVKQAYLAKVGEELDGADLMRKAFASSRNNNYTPVFPLADNSTESGRNIQDGYMNMFAGAMIGIRNPRAHANLVEDPNEAWEMITIASNLMRMWDKTKDYE